MWKIKDFFINLLLNIRLWFLIIFFSKRFNKVINKKEKDGWALSFNDEFNVGKLDRKKWRTDAYHGMRYHPGNIVDKGESPNMYYGDNCFEFTESTMKQVSKDSPINVNYVDWDGKDWGNYTIPYRIGQLDSSNSFEQKYGYFEIRSKITDQPGHWPAFWLASVYNWPPEIDVYEIYTGRRGGKKSFSSNFHWRDIPKDMESPKSMSPHRHKVLDVSDNFHIYAVEWNEDGFKVYYDNLLVRVFTNPKAIQFFEYPMHIIIGSGIDTGEGRKIEEAKFPTYHEIDYVRAYKKI